MRAAQVDDVDSFFLIMIFYCLFLVKVKVLVEFNCAQRNE